MSTSTDIAIIEKGGFVALQHDPAELQEILDELSEGAGFTERDLPRAKNPSGGATSWQIPGLAGPESVTEITGVIVAQKTVRAMFRKKDDNGKKVGLGSEPPLCSSVGIEQRAIGVGTPGGPCISCPYNQFGSAEEGNGKACGESLLWFMMQPETFIPLVVRFTPTSLVNARGYMKTTLGSRGIRFSSVLTSITLASASNDQGDYAIGEPRMVGMLDPAEAAAAREYGKQFAGAYEQVTAENLEGTAEEEPAEPEPGEGFQPAQPGDVAAEFRPAA